MLMWEEVGGVAMPNPKSEQLDEYLASMLQKLRDGNDRTLALLEKSYRLIAMSEKLLRVPVPKVWHREPPETPPETDPK